ARRVSPAIRVAGAALPAGLPASRPGLRDHPTHPLTPLRPRRPGPRGRLRRRGASGNLSDGAEPDRARAAVLDRRVAGGRRRARSLAEREGEDVVATGRAELVVAARGDGDVLDAVDRVSNRSTVCSGACIELPQEIAGDGVEGVERA